MSPSPLPKLPSIAELLQHPRVQQLTERVTESAIAQRAATFLEEIGSSVAKRTGQIEYPSLSQLAGRFAQTILGEPTSRMSVINATGTVLGAPGLAPPVAESALQTAVKNASEFRAPVFNEVEQRLQEAAGVEAALVLNNLEAAIRLLIGAWATGGEIAVQDKNALDGEGVVDWTRLAADHQAVARPWNDPSEAIILFRASINESQFDVPQTTGDLGGPTLANRGVDKLRERGAILVDVCPLAGVLDPAEYGLSAVPTVSSRLEEDFDLVAVDGAGLFGGPSCGILLGSRKIINLLREHPIASRECAGELTRATMSATADLFIQETAPIHTVPTWQLLSAPIENLQQRAERISQLLAASEVVESATPVESTGRWARCGETSLTAPSWQIELLPANQDANSFAAELHNVKGVSIRCAGVASANDELVRLDLRSVAPRWDQTLVDAVVQTRLRS